MPQHKCHSCSGRGTAPGRWQAGDDGISCALACNACHGKKVCDCAAGPDPCTVCNKHCGGHCLDKQMEQLKKEEADAKKAEEERLAEEREDESLRNLAQPDDWK